MSGVLDESTMNGIDSNTNNSNYFTNFSFTLKHMSRNQSDRSLQYLQFVYYN